MLEPDENKNNQISPDFIWQFSYKYKDILVQKISKRIEKTEQVEK